jgi:hypothetical protein
MARWYSANVLQSTAGGRRLWHLGVTGGRFTVEDEATLLASEPCPPLIVGKDWQTLFRPRLNIAWLPADQVFFRAAQLPTSDPAEIASMVELQLEKLSPLPVTHIVWSIYLLPRAADKPDALQTVIVIIAARSAVEAFLGQLEAEGYISDRLEAPGLEQLLAAKINEEGIWIFAGAAGEPALVAWCYGGTIQNLTAVTLSAGPERGPQLKTQLEQVAWAAEMEGWLTGPLKIHFVAGDAEAGFWQDAFKEWGEPVRVVPPASTNELAALTPNAVPAKPPRPAFCRWNFPLVTTSSLLTVSGCAAWSAFWPFTLWASSFISGCFMFSSLRTIRSRRTWPTWDQPTPTRCATCSRLAFLRNAKRSSMPRWIAGKLWPRIFRIA